MKYEIAYNVNGDFPSMYIYSYESKMIILSLNITSIYKSRYSSIENFREIHTTGLTMTVDCQYEDLTLEFIRQKFYEEYPELLL